MLFDSISLTDGADITNFVVASGSEFPPADTPGELFYRSDLSALYVYDGSSWGAIGGSSTFSVSAPLSSTGGDSPTVSITLANASTSGYLSNSDWTIFNGKQSALGFTPVNKAGDTMTGALLLNADPTNTLGAATKQYVDNVASGLTLKSSVRVATTENITLSGTQTIDGITVIVGDRVLVKNQTTATANGIYSVAAGAWTRSSDADNTPTSEVVAGMFCFVTEGTTNADTGWVLTTNNPISLGTSSLSFTQFSSTTIATAISGGTSGSIPYQTTSSSTSFIAAGTAGQVLTSSGSGAPTWSTPSYTIALSVNGKPTDGATLLYFATTRAFTIPLNATNAKAVSRVATTADSTISIYKNGTSIGTILFTAGSSTGTFSIAATSFTIGDILMLSAPVTVDTTLADISITIPTI